MRIGIIGATGWLGSALGGRLLLSQVAGPRDLVLLNRSGARPEYHGRRDLAWAADPQELAARSDVVVVSVRPEDWAGLRLRAEGRQGWKPPSGQDSHAPSSRRWRLQPKRRGR